MELTTNLKNLKFSEPTNIVGNLKKITIKTEGGKPLVVATGKCFSYGVKKDTKYKSTSMSLVLDDDTVKAFEEIISQCNPKPTKFLYRRDDGTTTIYAKLKGEKTKFYKDQKEIDPMTYEGKHCEARAVLAIEGLILTEKGANLQVKIHEATVREKVYEHVRLLDLKW